MASMTVKDPSFTIGIEEEYLLVDQDTRNLVQEKPPALFKKLEESLRGQVSPEFLRSQIEIGTRVCKSVQEARDELVHLRATVGRLAGEFGLAPIASSTHPFAHWQQQQHTDKERYNLLARDLQQVGRRLVICGMHVHVAIEDEDLRIDLLGQAPYFLPHLLALSTSSPFWEGTQTGLKSYRLAVFDELPRTGIPHQFSSWSEYQRTVDLLVNAGLIEDASKLWWDMRPSARFPTLEMRITDVCPLVEDGIAIAALYRCVLRMLYRLRRQNQRWRHYPPFLVRENRWRAQRYGIEKGMVDFGKGEVVPFSTLLDELIDLVAEDAAFFGCTAEIAHARTIVQRGTSADRQLARYDSVKKLGGSEQAALLSVVDGIVEETIMPPSGAKPAAKPKKAKARVSS
ncbi:MAG: carboxylate-amine ligase [Alphaproteobacteria bacterium]|nr:carboxylate-amine ligase [Alphaproteobacteria bacterium]